jgi:hypothetical protein
MAENLPQNPETQSDLLEQLLAGAAERETKKAMDELAQKGTVTKAEFSTALGEFEKNLVEKITSSIADKLQKGAPQATPEAAEEDEPEVVAKAGRKGTLSGAPSGDPRSDNPLKYIVAKARSGEELDQTDKELVWGLTMRGLTAGMSHQDIDGADFCDN